MRWRVVAGLVVLGAVAIGAATPLQQVENRVKNIERQLAALFTYQNDTTPPVDIRTGTTLGGSAIGSGGAGDFLADGSVPMTGDLDMDDNDIINPDAVGADIYYVDSVAEAQAALTRCGSDITGSTQSGCIVQFTGGLFDNGGTTLHLAGDGTAATGRAGVILRGVGGGGVAGDAGNPNSGTIIKASGAVPVIDVGACMGCSIEDLTIAGEDVATVGIDFLAPASTPTTRFVIRNVAMYEINGYGIRTAATGQVDTATFENVSVRDSDGCYQQRYTQNIGIILDAFDCSRLTGTGPAFDIQSGEFVFREGFLSLKTYDNAVGFSFGVETGLGEIRGSQIEIGGRTGIVIIDDDQGGSQTNEVGTKVFDANHVVFNQAGNTLIDAWRRGHWIVTNNVIDNVDGGADHTITTAFDRDTTTSGSRLIVTYAGNVSRNVDSGQSTRPEIWTPTTGSDVLVRSDVRFGADAPVVCKDGEIFVETDLATGSMLKICTAANTWTDYSSLISGGSGNSVEVILDFDTGAEIASTVVTGQTWVGSGSEIVCAPTMLSTTDRAEGAEDAVIEGLVVSAHSRVAGTGFTVTGAPRFGNAYGEFAIHCIGV